MSFELAKEAQKRISPYLHKTPVMTCTAIDEISGRKIFMKCDLFQKTGSFKARGALNAVLKLKEEENNTKGVVTHSSGNHGQALAWASSIAGFPCSVVLPDNTPKVKVEAIKSYGADVVISKSTPQDRAATCKRVAEEKGQVFIPTCDDVNVISGQATIAMEFLEQVPHLDAILVPLSGGGMISGISIAAKAIKPSVKVYAVEPFGKELESSLKAKKRLWPDPPRFINTIADGMRYQQVGQQTFPIMCDHVETKVFTVTDDKIIEAMKFCMQRMKVVIEPSSASGIAAVLSKEFSKLDPSIKNVGVIVGGGNVDLDHLPWIERKE